MGKVKDVVIQELIKAFSSSTLQAFETMAFTPLTAGAVESKTADKPAGYISGTIGFNGIGGGEGAAFVGSVSLMIPRALAERIFRAMMMMGEADPVDVAGLKDAVGELANMATGGAKANLQEKGLNFVISLPIVVIGEDHRLAQPPDTKAVVVPMAAADGQTLFMEMCVS